MLAYWLILQSSQMMGSHFCILEPDRVSAEGYLPASLQVGQESQTNGFYLTSRNHTNKAFTLAEVKRAKAEKSIDKLKTSMDKLKTRTDKLQLCMNNPKLEQRSRIFVLDLIWALVECIKRDKTFCFMRKKHNVLKLHVRAGQIRI
jgi:hypothetical protein